MGPYIQGKRANGSHVAGIANTRPGQQGANVHITSSQTRAPLSPQTFLTKHKFKDKIIKRFKTTAEH